MKTHGKWLNENWYRDLWLFLVTVAVVGGFLAIRGTTNEIQEGREATTGITCAVSAAVVKGGRVTIVTSSETSLPPKLEGFLKKYEYPSKAVRRKQAQLSGEAYTKSINAEIVKAAGVKASKVIEPDKLPNGRPNPNAGSLNCKNLRALAKLK